MARLALCVLLIGLCGCRDDQPLGSGTMNGAGGSGGASGEAGDPPTATRTPGAATGNGGAGGGTTPAMGGSGGTTPATGGSGGATPAAGGSGGTTPATGGSGGRDAGTSVVIVPQDAATVADAAPAASPCVVDSDCRLFEDYCTGCDCRALSRTDREPVCPGPGVRCFAPACMNKRAACEAGRCVVKEAAPAAATKWYATCGDPVCSGWRAKPDVPRCVDQKPGASCAKSGERCDPMNDCNSVLVCATTDPTGLAGCPISRRDAKRDIRYLTDAELRRYEHELLQLRLATWRYKHDPARERLGFIIDDHERSVAVQDGGQTVDLYGYTSLAVATLQRQAREIEALKAQVEELTRRLDRSPGRRVSRR